MQVVGVASVESSDPELSKAVDTKSLLREEVMDSAEP